MTRTIGAAFIVLSVAGLVAGGFLLGQRFGGRFAAAPTAPGLAPGETAGPDAGSPPPDGLVATLIGAGDIAECATTDDDRTADLVDSLPGLVFTAGDNAYDVGSAGEFKKCYDPTWGRFKGRTHPAIGNHDVRTANGAPYFAYFGPVAGTPLDGWYSFQAGSWHVVVLNSNCLEGTDCGEGSRQLSWLRADLAAHPAACTLAIWHHPRFSSGLHGSEAAVDPFWRALYAAGAELVINGHEHDYERFAPQDPDGLADPAKGIREIVVGTGGAELRPFKTAAANSEVRDARSHGVIVLELGPGSYHWQFLSTARRSFSDTGSGTCH